MSEPPVEINGPAMEAFRKRLRDARQSDTERLRCAEVELVKLREFVQWVADHSNDPVVVQEARKHGAE